MNCLSPQDWIMAKTKSWLFFPAFPQEAPEIRLNDELLDNFVNDVVEDIALKTEDSQGVKTMSTTNFNIYSMPGLVICLELFYFVNRADGYFLKRNFVSI